MSVDFERRSWQRPIRPDEHESSSRGKTALCRVSPLDLSASKEKTKQVNTAQNTQIHMFPPGSTFFLSHNFADIFFFFARDNAEVITAPSGTSTKHSIITKFSPLSKFTQYDGAQTTQVAHQ